MADNQQDKAADDMKAQVAVADATSSDAPVEVAEPSVESDVNTRQIFALVIEDDPDAAFIYKKALMDNDYRVDHIAHGGDAQEALKTVRPDVVLLDMHLPEVDGITLLRQIRSTEDMANTPVILVTADHSMATSVESEVNMVLLKPVSYSQVKHLVSRIVKKESREGN